MRVASRTAVGFIAPQPHMIIQAGRSRLAIGTHKAEEPVEEDDQGFFDQDR